MFIKPRTISKEEYDAKWEKEDFVADTFEMHLIETAEDTTRLVMAANDTATSCIVEEFDDGDVKHHAKYSLPNAQVVEYNGLYRIFRLYPEDTKPTTKPTVVNSEPKKVINKEAIRIEKPKTLDDVKVEKPVDVEKPKRVRLNESPKAKEQSKKKPQSFNIFRQSDSSPVNPMLDSAADDAMGALFDDILGK